MLLSGTRLERVLYALRPPICYWILRTDFPGSYTEDQDEHQPRADENLKSKDGGPWKGSSRGSLGRGDLRKGPPSTGTEQNHVY